MNDDAEQREGDRPVDDDESSAGDECDDTFDAATGTCRVEYHTHCPFCHKISECPHELAAWNDDWGMSGVEIPTVEESLWEDTAPIDWRDLVPAELHALVEAHEQEESQPEILDAALAVAGVEADCQRWEHAQSMASGFGYTWYVADRDAALAALTDVWRRLDEASDAIPAEQPEATTSETSPPPQPAANDEAPHPRAGHESVPEASASGTSTEPPAGRRLRCRRHGTSSV